MNIINSSFQNYIFQEIEFKRTTYSPPKSNGFFYYIRKDLFMKKILSIILVLLGITEIVIVLIYTTPLVITIALGIIFIVLGIKTLYSSATKE